MSAARGGGTPGGRLHSIRVGRPRTFGTAGASDPFERPWRSAILKHEVTGPRRVGRTNIDGDRQADLEHHGGVDKAVLAYGLAHYPVWQRELAPAEVPLGGFGENLLIDGLTERDVCIGDRWAVGEVVLQLSQPRQPCWKLARHLRIADIVQRVQETLRSGWYYRVEAEGVIETGAAVTLVDRPHPRWTVAEASRLMYDREAPPHRLQELAELPELSASWKRTLTFRASGAHVDTTARVEGPEA